MPNFYVRLTRSEDIDHGSTQGLLDHDHPQYPYEGNHNYSFQNIIRNGSFEQWTEEEPGMFAGWTREGDGVLTQDSTTVKVGTFSAKLQNNPASAFLLCHSVPPASFGYYKGRVVTFGCFVNTNVYTRARIRIDDGISLSYSNYHSGSGEWEFLCVTRTIALSATKLEFKVEINVGSSITAYFDGAVAVEGEFLPAFIPHVKDRSVGLGYENPEAFGNNVIIKTDTQYILELLEQSDVDWTDLDMNTAGSGLVPEKANAVILSIEFADSGFPAIDCAGALRKKGEIGSEQRFLVRPGPGGLPTNVSALVGVDSNGILQYWIDASGTGTATFKIRLVGWIEPA